MMSAGKIENPLVVEDTKADVKAEKVREWPQILAILIGSLAVLTDGIFLSWSSPYLLKISKDKENYDISEDEASYFPQINPIASAVSCLFASMLCDAIGRKKTLLLSAFPHSLAWILNASACSVYVFYIARCLAGISSSIVYTALPMYIGEVASPRIRGIFGNAMTSSLLLGELFITILGSYLDVQTSSYICLTIPVIFFLSFWFMPESPYFYLMKHRHEDAKASLRTLTGKSEVDMDLFNIETAVRRQMSESGTWKDLFTIDSNRRALVAGVFLRTTQLLGGFMTFLNFNQYIFEKSKITLSPQVSSMIFMGLLFILNICASLTVDKMGRRISFMCSVAPCAMVLLLESVYFYLDQEQPSIDLSAWKWFPFLGLILYTIFASYGISIIPTLMLGELFSASIKPKGLTVMMVVLSVTLFLGNYILYTLNSAFGLYAPFLFFSSVNATSFAFSFFVIPETKGMTLEEIQQSMKKKKNDVFIEDQNLLS